MVLRLFGKLKNGYLTEELFIIECLQREIAISRPIYNIEPYDFVCEINKCFVSVQVKKSWKDKRGLNIVSLKTSYPRSDKCNIITHDDRVDFIAAYVEEDGWYIIPRKVIKNINSNIAVSKNGKYAKYLNMFWGK